MQQTQLADNNEYTGESVEGKSLHALFSSAQVLAMSEKERRTFFAGKDIVMTGFAGQSGAVKIAEQRTDKLRMRYPEVYVERMCLQKAEQMQLPKQAGICGESAILPLAEGGVTAGLWQLAEAAGVGLEVELKRIPIRQETIEVCNFFDINPYQLCSDGTALMLAQNGFQLVQTLEREGISAAVIGTTNNGNDKVILYDDERRFVEKRVEDPIHRILGDGSET